MTDWLAGTAFLVYLLGVGACAHLAAHAWHQATAKDPLLGTLHEMRPALAPLFLALAVVGWPAIPLASLLTRTLRSTR
ncbi:hypothetical protein [Streptomyces sp. DH12]|uniref:hypothetical protein n=1 Tax=Streptomyces sp. DH12 TaxID=2857010 RepID=UPI001E652DB6|nr:hypothetical protein [Streptomyces sp. DH12]